MTRATLGTPGHKASKVRQVLWVLLDLKVHKAFKVLLVNKDLKEPPDPKDLKVRSALRVQQVLKVTPELKDLKVLLVHRDHKGMLVLRDLKVQSVQLVTVFNSRAPLPL